MATHPEIRGGCLCEGVRYTITAPYRPIINCFCGQCRKTSGHHFAATSVNDDQLKLHQKDTLTWFESSSFARRGFCNRCGSSLFWKRNASDTISITAGTMDRPTGLKTIDNIFTADMSDYHVLPPLALPPLTGDADND